MTTGDHRAVRTPSGPLCWASVAHMLILSPSTVGCESPVPFRVACGGNMESYMDQASDATWFCSEHRRKLQPRAALAAVARPWASVTFRAVSMCATLSLREERPSRASFGGAFCGAIGKTPGLGPAGGLVPALVLREVPVSLGLGSQKPVTIMCRRVHGQTGRSMVEPERNPPVGSTAGGRATLGRHCAPETTVSMWLPAASSRSWTRVEPTAAVGPRCGPGPSPSRAQ